MSQSIEKIKEWSGNVVKARTLKRKEYAACPALDRWFMDIYEREIVAVKKKNKQANVLILGATPETRDLILKHKLNLTSIDQNREMIKRMSDLMEYKSAKEKIVMANWLKMPLPDNNFDLVLGDGVSNNISYGQQENFFKEIKRVLKPDGVMLLREGVIDRQIPIFTIREILNSYRKNKDFPALFHKFNFYSRFSSRNKVKKYFDMAKMFENLAKQEKFFKADEFEKIMSWRGTIKHTILEADDLKSLIERVFGNGVLIENRRSNKSFVLKVMKFFKAVK